MKQLVLIGAGGFGREVAGWAQNSPQQGREWRLKGFLDDNPRALDGHAVDLPLLGDVWTYRPAADEVFVCAMGQPSLRAKVWEHFKAMGASFSRVIDADARIGPRVELGEGVILCPRVTLTCDLQIGVNTALNVAVAAGHDVGVGAHCQVSSFCDLTGKVMIGQRVFFGSRVSVLPGMRVGDDAVLGAGSVVTRDVEPAVTVHGNPARLLVRKA